MLIVSNRADVFVIWDPATHSPRTGLLSRSDVLRYLVPGGRTTRQFEKAIEDALCHGVGSYGPTPAPATGFLRFRSGRIRTEDVVECVRCLASAEPALVDRLIA